MQRRWLTRLIWIAVLVIGNGAMSRLHAADAEARAFNTAEEARQDGFPARAEKLFTEFIAKYPASPRVPQALLKQSKAALQQKKFEAAIQILSTNQARAGGVADQFLFDLAGIHAESGRFAAAATNYALVVSLHTNSPLRLDATLAEAHARFQLKQWPRVLALLQAGLFQEAATRAPASEAVVRGRLLLADTLLEQRDYAGAERVAGIIPEDALAARTKWERSYRIAQAQWGARRLDDALVTTSNLFAVATATTDVALEAAASALQGQILEALNRPDEAIAVYARNQRPGMPASRTREAVFKTVELLVEQGQLSNALARLQEFVVARPNETGSDLALLAQAELRLKQHQLALTSTNGVAPGTDLLADVIFDCDKLLTQFTNSPFRSQARAVRGWALLAQGKFGESLTSFRAAAETLPWSEAQAVARFKSADLAFQSGDLTNAIADYRLVLTNYAMLPRVVRELTPRARYQLLQAGLAARDRRAAAEALDAILREYPDNGYAERSLLLFGQTVDELGDPAAARKEFARFTELFPTSPLRPEVELAVARSYERERDWSAAINQYDSWLRAFPTNAEVPRAEFLRAMANSLAGHETNALTLFTNIVVRFPLNPLAARAQNWIGDHYSNIGQYDDALRNYQLVFENTNWPVSLLSYEARLKAGRAALAGRGFGEAALHLTNLLEDTSCPTSVLAQAYFAYGEAFLKRQWTNALDNYNEARKVYARVARDFPANEPLVPRAYGEMANCYFQLGTRDEANYAEALENYGKATNSPVADSSTRQQALVGIGHVMLAQSKVAKSKGLASEATALLNAALTNYLEVIYPTREGEAVDPLWLKEATFSAGIICESQGEWERALNLFVRLAERIPSLKEAAAKRIESIQRQLQQQRL
jgi:tetratricopeptide (TPR) repeat protein